MKRLKDFRNSWLVLIMIFAVVACNDKDDTFSADADVVFLKKKVDGQIFTGVAYYLYANSTLESVTVTLPESGGTLNLEPFELNTYVFMYEPKDEDFLAGFPVIGEYVFKATNTKGEYLEVFDEQEFDNIGFAQIDSTNFDLNQLWFYVNWNEVPGADSYLVRLLKLSGDIIFNGFTITADTPEYFVSRFYNTGTWTEAPVKGQKYILQINSLKYDNDATDNDFIYNVQELSTTDMEITWLLD